MKYASFYVGDHIYGIPIYMVQEISRPSAIYEIPGHDRRIAGLINLRGRTAVAINMHQCFYGTNASDISGRRQKLIILETGDGLPAEAIEMGIDAFDEPIVLLVDDMFRITSGEKEQFFSTPAHVKEQYVDGVIKIEEKFITLISISRLLEDILAVSEGSTDET